MSHLTDRDVASHFGISWQQVQARCKAGQWPHLRIGRTYRFTPRHVELIESLTEVLPAEPESQAETWGRKKRGAS